MSPNALRFGIARTMQFRLMGTSTHEVFPRVMDENSPNDSRDDDVLAPFSNCPGNSMSILDLELGSSVVRLTSYTGSINT
jgi:hypothetical protein